MNEQTNERVLALPGQQPRRGRGPYCLRFTKQEAEARIGSRPQAEAGTSS